MPTLTPQRQAAHAMPSAVPWTQAVTVEGLLDGNVQRDVGDKNRFASNGSHVAPVRLEEACRPAVLAHFLRLSDGDRHMRFLQVMSDPAIENYVARIDFSKAICFGIFKAPNTLIAFAEAIPYRAGSRLVAEAAFSTDQAWRQSGLARQLCDCLGQAVLGVGVDRVVLHCLRRNAPMRALLRAIDAVSDADDGDLHSEWDPGSSIAPAG